MARRIFLLAGIFFLTIGLSAQTELKVAVGLALPPYVIQETNSGLEVDIVKQVLTDIGYSIKLEFVPFARVPVSLQTKEVAAALTINEGSGVQGVFYSDTHISYQNVVVALKSKSLSIPTIGDLKNFRIVAFQNAPDYLGTDFAAMAKANTKYAEMGDQQAQVKMLFAGRTDVIIMDINIYKFFKSQIKDVDVSADTVFYELFPPTAFKVAFVDKGVRDKFNVSLKKLRDSGKYATIFKSYIK